MRMCMHDVLKNSKIQIKNFERKSLILLIAKILRITIHFLLYSITIYNIPLFSSSLFMKIKGEYALNIIIIIFLYQLISISFKSLDFILLNLSIFIKRFKIVYFYESSFFKTKNHSDCFTGLMCAKKSRH